MGEVNIGANPPSFENFSHSVETGAIQILVQTVMGRSGSLFLQSVLDNHREILMFPSVLNYFKTYRKTFHKDKDNWIKNLITQLENWMQHMKPYNMHQNLGENQDLELNFELDKLLEGVENELTEQDLNPKNIFLAFHYCWAVKNNVDLNRVKYIYTHEHFGNLTPLYVRRVLADFPHTQFLCITRSPISNYLSIKNWRSKLLGLNMDIYSRQYYSKNFFFTYCYDWYINYLNCIDKFSKHFYLLKLEDIQRNKELMLGKLCEALSINFEKSLLETTYGGLLWHGDNMSPKSSGFRKPANEKALVKQLSPYNTFIICTLLKKELNVLGYEIPKISPIAQFFYSLAVPLWVKDDVLANMETLREKSKENGYSISTRLRVFFKFMVEPYKNLFFCLKSRQTILNNIKDCMKWAK